MKTCPECGELNGDNSTQCFKCGTHMKTSNYRKICPKCGQIYQAGQDYCSSCPDSRLSVYAPEYAPVENKSTVWMYIIGFLIPPVGIVLGIVYIARREDDLGKSLLLFSIFAPLVVGALIAIMTSIF